MTRFLFSFLLLFATINPVISQIHKKYLHHGDKLMEQGDYYGALRNYQLAMDIDSSDVSLRFAFAQSLSLTNNYRKALFYFKSVQRYDKGREYTLSMHYAGEMYKYLGEYSKSLKEHRRFVKSYKGDKGGYEYKKSLHEVSENRELNHLLRDTSSLVLSNKHEVNTAQSEFSAFIVDKDQMLYSTLRSDSVKKRLVLDSTTYYARIHVSEYKSSWQPGPPHPAFHSEEAMHIANPFYSPRRDFIYYTECSKGRCEIFRARNDKGTWTDFELLPDKINLPASNNSQPSLARIDGLDYLFFVSDRPGGKGRLDVWYSIAYSNGLFEEPVNLGDSVNSPGNDICPFYLMDEEALYFSSDWHMGLGGFDIFRCIRIGDKYRHPENMGMPFNSSYNDLYFRQTEGQAVLTSNRLGSFTDKYQNCCNDLFFFDYEAKTIVPEVALSGIEKIEKLLPLRLYFNNDEPNPRSRDTSSSILYSATYIQYVAKEPVFQREYSKGLKNREKESAEEEIEHFFESDVKLGYEDLKEALNLLEQELKTGQKIELVIKGFASPLSANDYNRRLTLRRISSVENEIRHFKNGALVQFLDEHKLVVTKQPFGEDRLSEKVSDDFSDKRNAIFSQKASFERRVEIVAVRKM